MTVNTAYEALLAHQKECAALDQVAQLLHWDQETMMPPKGASQRAEQAATLMGVLHRHRIDPRISDWLTEIDAAGLDDTGQQNLFWISRRYERAQRVPAELAIELARARTEGHEIWLKARETRRFADFAPTLSCLVELTRAQAECLREGGETLYDALLDDCEPGATEAGLAEMFDRLRPRLTQLGQRIAESGHTPPRLSGEFPAEAQMALARETATMLGYDWQAGRLDTVVHPFATGTLGDVRITARIDERDLFHGLLAAIHETGHALYEQGLDPDLAWQPAGGSVSMGVHESQSRLIENQVGRSADFAGWLMPRIQAAFGDTGIDSAQGLYRALNHVTPGFIRTEADEVHYNLHVGLRFDLERALLTGDLPVADLEGAWNERFAADFGRTPPDALQGVLQDVHWSAGLIGYFPTYTLGNIYAGELWAALCRDIPEPGALIGAGEMAPLVGWLRSHVHRHGSRRMPAEIVANACGHEPSEGPLLDYLEAKFTELYEL